MVTPSKKGTGLSLRFWSSCLLVAALARLARAATEQRTMTSFMAQDDMTIVQWQ